MIAIVWNPLCVAILDESQQDQPMVQHACAHCGSEDFLRRVLVTCEGASMSYFGRKESFWGRVVFGSAPITACNFVVICASNAAPSTGSLLNCLPVMSDS
jgi:hypothetical protein